MKKVSVIISIFIVLISATFSVPKIFSNMKTYKAMSAEEATLHKQISEHEDEINKLNEKKPETTPTNPSTTNQPTSSDSSKNGTQTGISNTNGQVQAGSDKTSEKASDAVSDQNKNVGANNEQ